MRISFDLDGTLDDDFDGSINNQKIEIQNLCKKYIKDGHTVFLCTKRWGPDHKNEGLKNEHLKAYYIANRLGIDLRNVYFTNRLWKDDTIKNLGIEMHFENSDIEVKMIEKLGVKVVPVEDPYWRDLVY